MIGSAEAGVSKPDPRGANASTSNQPSLTPSRICAVNPRTNTGMETTTVVPPRAKLRNDKLGYLHIEVEPLPAGDPAQDALFRDGCAERDVPVFIHASLLVNLGSPTPTTYERSVASVAHNRHRERTDIRLFELGATMTRAGAAVDDVGGHVRLHLRRRLPRAARVSSTSARSTPTRSG